MGIRVRGLIGGVILFILIITVTLVPSKTSVPRVQIGADQSDDAISRTAVLPIQTSSPENPITDSGPEDKERSKADALQADSGMQQPHRTHTHSHSESDDIRLLIGVMSPFWTSARRHIIRNAYSKFPKNLPVDIVFVQGNLTAEHPRNAKKVLAMQRKVVAWENETHHDIMMVDCVENLVYGKTYEYLKKVGREFGHYTHVMKTDDDSFVNIPGHSVGNHLTKR
jgi:hypothetical protein